MIAFQNKLPSAMFKLPTEVWMRIFDFLNKTSLLQVTEVCKEWLLLGKEPLLWKKFPVIKHQKNIQNIHEVFAHRRFALAENLQIIGVWRVDKILFGRGVINIENQCFVPEKGFLTERVKNIKFQNCDLSHFNERWGYCKMQKLCF